MTIYTPLCLDGRGDLLQCATVPHLERDLAGLGARAFSGSQFPVSVAR